jgi:hypothetical protein
MSGRLKIPEKSKDDEANQAGFPTDVFHSKLQAVADEFAIAFSFHPDHIGLGMLSALATAIGDRYRAVVRRMHEEPAILWAVLVGRPGTGKTHVIDHLFKPFIDADDERYKVFEDELKAHELEEGNGTKPKFVASVLRDFTFEGLAESVKLNPRGSVILSDEILAMTGNMNRYNKGNDEPFYLTLYSGHGISTTRKTQTPIHTKRSCVNIIGGIQPARLQELLTRNRMQSGFADRFLFAFPDAERQPWTDTQFNQDIRRNYSQVIKEIMGLNPETPGIKFDEPAWNCLLSWQHSNTEAANEMDRIGDLMAGLLSKWESYVCRFALILQISADVCAGRDPTAIGLEAVEGAIRLFDYFLTQSRKAFSLVYQPEGLESLNDNPLRLFAALPEEFTTQKAIECGRELDPPISERSVYDYIANTRVYIKTDHGNYRKCKK